MMSCVAGDQHDIHGAGLRRFVYGSAANARNASSADTDESNPVSSATDQNADIARIWGVARTVAAVSSIHIAFRPGMLGSSLDVHSVMISGLPCAVAHDTNSAISAAKLIQRPPGFPI